MGHLGFSYIGLIWLLMLFVPNIVWTKYKPEGYAPEGENKILSALEKIGEVAVTVLALIFSDFNVRSWSPWNFWLIASAVCMAAYEGWWIKYFLGPKKLKNFYSSFLGIPLAGATLPVAAFLLLGIYGKVVWLILAAIVLGVGHVGIHIGHFRIIKKAAAKESGGERLTHKR